MLNLKSANDNSIDYFAIFIPIFEEREEIYACLACFFIKVISEKKRTVGRSHIGAFSRIFSKGSWEGGFVFKQKAFFQVNQQPN